MIKRFLTRHSNIAEATVILAVASLISRFFGLLRDRTLAAHFGAGPVLDSYFAAFKIPDLVFNLLILGALSSAFIPIFTEYLKRNKDEAWALVNTLINVGVALLATILLVLFILAPTVAHLVAPGFDAERLTLVVKLMRIMLLSPLIFGLSNLVGGVLNAYRNFFVYSIAPILYNLGIIFGVLFLVPRVGPVGLAYGVVLGALLHLMVQVPSFFLLGYRYQPHFNFRHQGLRQIGALMLPRTLGLAIDQLAILANTIIASTLAVGSIAVLNLTDNIYNLPISLFGISLAVAVFPTLSEQAVNNERVKFSETVRNSFRQIVFFIVPAMFFYWVFRAQIIRLVFGAGLFGWEDTRFTISALAFMTVGMMAHATMPLLARAFYAKKDTATPLIMSIVSLVTDIIFALILVRYLKVVGLALAVALAGIVDFAGLVILLQRKIRWFSLKESFGLLINLVAGSLLAAGAGYVMLRVVNLIVTTHRVWGLLIQTFLSGLVFLLVYLAVTRLLKVPEAKLIKNPLQFVRKVFVR